MKKIANAFRNSSGRKRRRAKPNRHVFETLEPRMMLSGNLPGEIPTGPAASSCTSTPAAQLAGAMPNVSAPSEQQVLAGDYDGSGTVDAADYVLWKNSYGSVTQLAADGNNDRIVDLGDYTIYADNLVIPSNPGAADVVFANSLDNPLAITPGKVLKVRPEADGSLRQCTSLPTTGNDYSRHDLRTTQNKPTRDKPGPGPRGKTTPAGKLPRETTHKRESIVNANNIFANEPRHRDVLRPGIQTFHDLKNRNHNVRPYRNPQELAVVPPAGGKLTQQRATPSGESGPETLKRCERLPNQQTETSPRRGFPRKASDAPVPACPSAQQKCKGIQHGLPKSERGVNLPQRKLHALPLLPINHDKADRCGPSLWGNAIVDRKLSFTEHAARKTGWRTSSTPYTYRFVDAMNRALRSQAFRKQPAQHVNDCREWADQPYTQQFEKFSKSQHTKYATTLAAYDAYRLTREQARKSPANHDKVTAYRYMN